ncbi:hypothetical protein [Nocardia noduli]|uniref:hypothetical protein n=1 Tax=Nocardia noduli TaxID=2815722 RepID=UPI001C25139A|nr:hypothetical protein [Nocardia noduli]
MPGTTRAPRIAAADLAPAPVWVLVVSGLLPQPTHVSLHTHRSDAEGTLTTVTREHLTRGGQLAELDITLVSRTPATD